MRDLANNQQNCSFNVTVVDRQAPSVTCPSFPAPEVLPVGANTKNITWGLSFTDNAGSAGVVTGCTPAPGPFGPGSYSVTCTATDASNNVGSCLFSLSVVDREAPQITCRANDRVSTDAGVSYRNYTYLPPTTSDNVAVLPPTCSPGSGSQFTLGRNLVLCTVLDASQNINTCKFTVEVADNEKPVVLCPQSQTFTIYRNQSTFSSTQTVTAATDNSGSVFDDVTRNGTLLDSLSFTYSYPIGDTTLVHTATDSSTNRDSCEWHVFVVQVGDFLPPNITNCPNSSFLLNTDAGKASARFVFFTRNLFICCCCLLFVVCCGHGLHYSLSWLNRVLF